MNHNDIREWAVRVIRQVETKQPNEDSTVELKTELDKDTVRAAKQISGHANAARGQDILWLIGVRESDYTVVGARPQELSSWWQGVRSKFEGVPPSFDVINVVHNGVTVMALFFDTSNAPFVVNNPTKAAGEFERGVFWREGTSTRAATQSDLILLLNPLKKLPKISILKGELRYIDGNATGPGLALSFGCYAVPLGDRPVTLPFHLCRAELRFPDRLVSISVMLASVRSEFERQRRILRNTKIGLVSEPYSQADPNVPDAIHTTDDEVIIMGAGKMTIKGQTSLSVLKSSMNCPEVPIVVTLVEAVSEAKLEIAATLYKTESKNGHVWTYYPAGLVEILKKQGMLPLSKASNATDEP